MSATDSGIKSNTEPAKPRILGAAFLLVTTFLVYIPAMRGGFIWDDPDYVLHNHTLRDLDGLRSMWLDPTSLPQWYPLVHTSFWIEYHLVGTQPMLYHVDNVLLHAVSAILIWGLLKKLQIPGAFFAACVFAVHPVMVESVAWVTERKNTLSLVFYLLALREYLFQFAPSWVDGPKPNWRAYALALAFFLAALFSKTVTASLPAAILLIIWWRESRLRVRDVLPLIPFFVAGIAMGAVTGDLESHHVGASGEFTPELNFSFAQRCLIAGRAIWFYLGKLVFPYPLTFIYPRWNSIDLPSAVQSVIPGMVVVVTGALFALRGKIGRGPVVAWLLFCGTLFPALGFVNVYPMRYSFVADHFQYHASVAAIVLVCAVAMRLPPRMRGAMWGAVIAILGLLTVQQTRIYANAETLWRDTVAKNPNSWMVWTNLGNALAAQGKYDDAIPCHERAVQLDPNVCDTLWNYGVALMRQKKIDEAETQFRKAIAITPQFALGYESLGEIYLYHRNDPETAATNFQKAIDLAPTFAKALCNYAILKERASQIDEAIQYYRRAVAADPDYLEAHYNLGNCLAQTQNFDEAIGNFREAIRINPNYAQAWTNLGSALYQTGRFREAGDAFAKALAIDPSLDPARRGYQAARSRG